MPQSWPFIDSATFRREHFRLGKFREAKLRKEIPSPLYWIKPDRNILWNLHLVTDYLLNGDGPEHQALVQRYLATLPNRTA